MCCICSCTHSFAVLNFNNGSYLPACPMLEDEMPGAVIGPGGYCACGANVATEACGRERQRGRQGNINGGIK